MATTRVANARQSQLVTTYGVGGLFPAAEQSFVVCGLDEWSVGDRTRISEPRLARSLGVNTFHRPPSGGRRGDVPVTRFPLMHYCPGCRRLGEARLFGAAPTSMVCDRCARDLTPSRFVACCENGHIEDFPYWLWLHSGASARSDEHELSLTTLGKSSSLGDLVISCSCGVPARSMAGAFGPGALKHVGARCHGRHPWLLEAADADCESELRTLQRGSSNVWFAMMRSAISIPPWSSATARFVDQSWNLIKDKSVDDIRTWLEISTQALPDVKITEALSLVAQRRGDEGAPPPTESELRADEYGALRTGEVGPSSSSFSCTSLDVPASLTHLVAAVSRVDRLREVRALEGFTRLIPPSPDMAPARKGKLARTDPGWLPAIEVHGEGVYVELRADLVDEWVSSVFANERVALLNERQETRDRELGRPTAPPVTARFVALHTLAHILLTEMSLYAGYPVSALRERVYAEGNQVGILIYTASSDSAGSLGGLAVLSDEEKLTEIVSSAIARASWCSSDPVCSEARWSGADGLNLAACHACVLLPETSCEHRNLYLDRLSVVGSAEDPEEGLLGELLVAE